MKTAKRIVLACAVPLFAGGVVLALGTFVASGRTEYASAAASAAAAKTQLTEQPDLRTVFEHVAEAIRPSVVSIATTKTVGNAQGLTLPPGMLQEFGGNGLLLRRFGSGSGDDSGTTREHGVGSGLILTKDGYILTNNHVVDDASDLEVYTCDEHKFKARLIGADPRTDLAVIKIDADDLVPAKLGDSDALKVGQWVSAFGSPFGLDQTMSTGIVSAKGRANMHISDYEDFVQTDAAINPGNSGGPLVDLRGEVVGINSAIISRSGGSQGIGLAIPSNMAKDIVSRLIQDGRVVRGWLGVAIQEVTPQLGKSFQFEGRKGVLIGDVTADSPAAKAGLEAGDIVSALNAREVESLAHFRADIAGLAPGAKAELGVWRDGASRTLSVVIGTAPENSSNAPAASATQRGFGLELIDASQAANQGLELAPGTQGAVIARVLPGSAAEEAGLQAGDVIVEIADSKAAVGELRTRLDQGAVLRVQRNGSALWLQMPAATK